MLENILSTKEYKKVKELSEKALLAYSESELKRMGLNNSSIKKINAVKEIASIYNQRDSATDTPEKINEYFHKEVKKDKEFSWTVESFFVVILDNKLVPKELIKINIGTSSSCHVDGPRMFKQVLLSGYDNFAVIHNHPSGQSDPSFQDDNTTIKLSTGSSVLSLNFIDHIITTENKSFYSFKS